jgi:hypothetical protein
MLSHQVQMKLALHHLQYIALTDFGRGITDKCMSPLNAFPSGADEISIAPFTIHSPH